MSVRFAIIGAGVMGADHARIVAEDLPGAELRLVCDASEPRARAVAETHGAPHATTDPKAAIARDDIDAVIVASPDFTHAPLVLACVAAGKPVLCEKPLSQSPIECVQVMQAESEAGRSFVQLGFMRRYDRSYGEMRAALRAGTLGRALMMHNIHRNVEIPAADFTGAMAITNSAPHEFDVIRFVLDTDFTAISAWQARRSDALVAPVLMVLETADGQLVNIEVNNNAAYGYDVRGELVGERGAISLIAPSYSRLDADLRQSVTHDPDWRPRYGEAYRRQDRAFLDFVRTDRFPAHGSDCWDGYAAAVVAEAGARALRQGTRVTVDMIEKPAFYAKRKEIAE